MTTAESALAEIAHDLYGVPPGEFTAARNARAKRAKAEGDPDLAKAVGGLRKPNVAAWVVNLMVRQLPERIGDLVSLGDELRSAQDDMDAATLRALTRQRRALTATVAKEGADLAAEMGQKVSAVVTEQVQATLHAAMTDELAATAVRSGVLLGPLEATGLDEVDLTETLAIPLAAIGEPTSTPGPREKGPTDLSARRSSAKAKAAKEVTEAKSELAVAEAAATKTGKTMRARKDKVRTLQAQVLQLRAELDELLRQVEALEQKLDPVVEDLESAQETYAEAEAMDIAAKAAVERAQRRLDKARATASR
ncbi:hypothetical protein [Pseudactinotalea suaedae]|uniref:hypothetical protein n=1 Tax=Pseudactinotalea suaedae TaxID=1524924 RepID=UPI0012E324F5|nr:hypothetical protein [Pseudactinotalea suaedae]